MKVAIKNRSLILELEGVEKLWALKDKLTIQRKDIEKIEWHDVFTDWKKWQIRLPGTYLPGKLLAGSFKTSDGWDFLYIRRPHGWQKPFVYSVLVIDTKIDRYKRVIISFRKEEVKEILDWWSDGAVKAM